VRRRPWRWPAAAPGRGAWQGAGGRAGASGRRCVHTACRRYQGYTESRRQVRTELDTTQCPHCQAGPCCFCLDHEPLGLLICSRHGSATPACTQAGSVAV
jgi:hypothetical protein